VDIDTEEEPMELPKDDLDIAEDNADVDVVGGDSADLASQEEAMQKMVVMTQLLQMVVMMTQMKNQSQPP
jgi:hypothetical protein